MTKGNCKGGVPPEDVTIAIPVLSLQTEEVVEKVTSNGVGLINMDGVSQRASMRICCIDYKRVGSQVGNFI
ncbi:MAG: hypothetical protein IPP86_02525 [Bacteroidetes bacterium]|nr:hypothetical protein [Bacteroidota bacterium]